VRRSPKGSPTVSKDTVNDSIKEAVEYAAKEILAFCNIEGLDYPSTAEIVSGQYVAPSAQFLAAHNITQIEYLTYVAEEFKTLERSHNE
jgi:hypothetical protein